MSSWRNLMTPPQERYYISEGSPSLEDSFCHDKFHHEVSDFTAEVSSRQPVIQSKNFKELHNQLNSLQDDLGRSSIRAKLPKESILTKQASTFKKSDFIEATPRPTLETKRKGILRGTTTHEKELNSASTCSGFSRKFLSKEVEVRAFDQSGGMYLEESLDDKTPENKSDEEAFSFRTRRSSLINKSILSTHRKDKKSNKKVEFRADESEILKSNNKLQETLYECCQQISELKQIALISQKQITTLCEEVVKQKNESEEVRKHLGLSVKQTPVKKTNYSSAKTYLKHSTVLKDSTSSQEEDREPCWTKAKTKQTKNISPTQEAPESYRGQRIKNRRTISSFIGGYCEESTKESSTLKQSFKEASVQCDAMLDAIVDYDEEEHQQREKEIQSLRAEVNIVKEQKKDMISVFQQMLTQLEASEQRDAKDLQEKVTETKKTFSDFYTTFNSKLQSLNHQRLGSSQSFYKSRSQMK